MTETVSLFAMLSIGLLGAGHCLGMCGGLSAALGMAATGNRLAIILSYNLGRIFSYSVAGALVGWLSYWGDSYLAAGPWLRIAAGVLLVLMGCYLAGWWHLLVWLERGGTLLWRRIQPLANRCLPVTTAGGAVAAGMLWGWLPCGLVYSALAYAATSVSAVQGAAMMAMFGVGTLPALLAGGFFAEGLRRLLLRQPLQKLMGLALILFGVWMVFGVVQHHLAEPSAATVPHHPITP